jgi:hypothetical protein
MTSLLAVFLLASPSPSLEEDVSVAVSGNFLVDHLGPEGLQAATDRLRAHADEALDALEAILAGPRRRRPESKRHQAERLSAYFPATLLRLLADRAPEHARALAIRWLAVYRQARRHTEDEIALARLDERIAELEASSR